MSVTSKAPLPMFNSPHVFICDGGLETDLIFKHGFDLPYFAAWPLLENMKGRTAIRDHYIDYVKVALRHKTGIVLETATWRASSPWFPRLGYSAANVPSINRSAVHMLEEIKHGFESSTTPIVISGCIGPLRDAYKSGTENTAFFAKESYYEQVHALAQAGVDMLSLMSAVDISEAKAVVRLAQEHKLPIAVSFSLESNGRLLSGRTLSDAINEVDRTTNGYVSYFGVNCAHPCHFMDTLRSMDRSVLERIGSIRANATRQSHDELETSTFLDREDVKSLAQSLHELRDLLPNLRVVGGCCGTDEEHASTIASRFSATRHEGYRPVEVPSL